MVVQFRIGLSLTPPTMGATFTCLEQRLDNLTANGEQKVGLLPTSSAANRCNVR